MDMENIQVKYGKELRCLNTVNSSVKEQDLL